MFKKKKCKKCGKNVNNKFDFCPLCGNLLDKEFEKKQEDFGMLGKNDAINLNPNLGLPFGFNKIFNALIKNLGNELNREFSKMQNDAKNNSQNKKIKQNGVSIKISTLGNNPPEIQIESFGEGIGKIKKTPDTNQNLQKNLSSANQKKSISLPKEEPITNVKRFSDKVVYEIDIPGVKDIEDVAIVKLENSIEIKALTRDKVYAKIIPISLPITNYNLSKGKLILELGEN